MKIDFAKQKLHLVITPLDMRLGFSRFYEIDGKILDWIFRAKLSSKTPFLQ